MSMSAGFSIADELQLMFGAICDGLRQEVRARRVLQLRGLQAISVAHESERGLATVLAHYLRTVGFFIQTESYLWMKGDQRRQPDFRIWLGKGSQQPFYLELKQYGWGARYSYDHTYVRKGINEAVAQLSREAEDGHLNGMVVVGFSRPNEAIGNTLEAQFGQLTVDCFKPLSYKEFAVCRVEFPKPNPKTEYAMVGLWIPDWLSA